MPKGKRGKPPEDKPRSGSEVVQFRPPVGGGVPPAPVGESPIDLTHLSQANAVKILTDLSALNMRAVQAEADYEKAKGAAKDAKAKWEGLVRQVTSKLKEATRPLPLFDKAKSEADLTAIQQAAAAAPAQEEPAPAVAAPAAPESVPAAPETVVEVAPAEPPAAGPGAQEPAIF